MNDQQSANRAVILSIRTPSGFEQRQKLIEGTTLIVGHGQNCGLRLSGPKISPMHCVLRLHQGQLTVQDWCSQSGTFLGESQVSEEMRVRPGMIIRIAEYQISHTSSDDDWRSVEEAPQEQEPADEAREADASELDETPAGLGETWAGESEEPEEHPESGQDAGDRSPEMSDDADLSTALVRESCAARRTEPTHPPADSRPPSRTFPLSTDEEAIGLMQEEIELLQAELAERDARIRELEALLEQATPLAPTADAAELDGLMGRLEELLNELGQGDQRIRSLEELLRASQEANQAEQEERQQIEKWLNDIEFRLSERQSEWLAEREVLTRRLEEQRGQRDELYRQLEQATQAASSEVPRGALQRLQNQVDAMQEQLQEADERRRKAEEQVKTLQRQLDEGTLREQVEAAVREERLKLAQERADLSRERAEFARQGSERSITDHGNRVRDADARFQVFRQTLRELHQHEAKPIVQKSGLGSRLAELWRRLDGPTDTD